MAKIKKTTTFVTAIFFLSVGCNSNDANRGIRYNTPKSDVISIGVVYPVTSRNMMNTHFSKGIEFAVNRVNQNGGILNRQLSIVVRDDENNANIAMQIAQTFCARGITAVIGHWSTNVSYYTQDIYEKNNVVMLTPRSTGTILFEKKFNYTFRMVCNNRVFAEAITSHIAEKGYKHIAVYYSDDVFGTDLAKTFERELNTQGIRVVDRVTGITPLNIERILNRWNAFGCEAVIMAAAYPIYVEPINIIRGSGSILPIYGDDSFERFTHQDLRYGGFDGLYIATLNRENLDAEFFEMFHAEYGHAPDVTAINGYEAVMLFKDAMETVKSISGSAIAEFLSNLKDYETVSGIRTYNSKTQEFDGYDVYVIPLESLIFEDNGKSTDYDAQRAHEAGEM